MDTPKKSLVFLFILVSFTTIIGAYLHLTHSPAGIYVIEAALILYLLFDILCLIRIYRAKTMMKVEKWIYGIAVVLLGWAGGLLYLLFADRRQTDQI